jgi:hypothetical protein
VIRPQGLFISIKRRGGGKRSGNTKGREEAGGEKPPALAIFPVSCYTRMNLYITPQNVGVLRRLLRRRGLHPEGWARGRAIQIFL